jgi:hypothetical protein
VPFVGSGSPIQLLGAGPHPVFIPFGEPKAHGDTTKQLVKPIISSAVSGRYLSL